MEKAMCKYRYDGPVTEFGRLIADRWVGETMAVSEQKAKSNLIFQFKTRNNRIPATRVELPGKILKEGA